MRWSTRLLPVLMGCLAFVTAPSPGEASGGRLVQFTAAGKSGDRPIRLQVMLYRRSGGDVIPSRMAFDGSIAPGQSAGVVDEHHCLEFRHTYGELRKVNWSDWIMQCPRGRKHFRGDLWIQLPNDRPYNVQR